MGFGTLLQMDCHSPETTNALVHPPAAGPTLRICFPRHRQTLPREVRVDGGGQTPRSGCALGLWDKTEEHVPEGQR